MKNCKHKNQEKIDWATNKCKDCNRLIASEQSIKITLNKKKYENKFSPVH